MRCQNSCLHVGCYDEFSYCGLLINNTDVFLTTLEAGGSHLCQQGWFWWGSLSRPSSRGGESALVPYGKDTGPVYGVIVLDLKALSPYTTILGLGEQELNSSIIILLLTHHGEWLYLLAELFLYPPHTHTTNVHAGSVLTSVFLTVYIYGKYVNRTFSHYCFSTTLDSQ